jgi:hypothetical protein
VPFSKMSKRPFNMDTGPVPIVYGKNIYNGLSKDQVENPPDEVEF